MMGTGSDQRFVIASLGSIGKRHLRNLRELYPEATIAALRRPESAPGLPPECDTQFFTVEDALAFKPTAAILAGPASTHVALAHAFVSGGIPVFIEKPLSHNLAGLAELRIAAQTGNVPVMIGYNLRFNQSLNAVRKELMDSVIGDVTSVRAEVGQYLPNWRPETDYRNSVSAQSVLGGGVLLELSHEIDYIVWLFGMPDRVFCRGGRLSKLEIDVEDCVELCLEYDAPRRLISVHLDFLQRTPVRVCKFIGSHGTICWNGIRDRYSVDVGDPTPDFRVVESPTPGRNQTYLDELSCFLAAIETGEPVAIPLTEGIDVMCIISAARQSMKSGQVEEISVLEPLE